MERGDPIVMLVQDDHEVFSEQLVDLNREGLLLEAIMHSGWDDDSGDPLLSAYDHYVETPWYRLQEAEPPPALTLKALLILGGNTDHGLLVRAVAVPWFEILKILRQDPAAAYQIDWRRWEEIIAGAYTRAGFDEVILTPRSGDGGKDIIATKRGVGSVRIFDQVKAYKPTHLVDADEVRSMLGVITAHQNVSKGIITTTSDFAPRVLDDPAIAPFVPYRLELKPREPLLTWLKELSDTKD